VRHSASKISGEQQYQGAIRPLTDALEGDHERRNGALAAHTTMSKLALDSEKWYNCGNPDCMTNVIVPPEFRVWNEHGAQRLQDVVTRPTEDGGSAQLEGRSCDKPPLPPIKSKAVFVKNGFKASLCLECAHIDLIPANEDHKPCTICGAEPCLPRKPNRYDGDGIN
jgi:hypothetical protein